MKERQGIWKESGVLIPAIRCPSLPLVPSIVDQAARSLPGFGGALARSGLGCWAGAGASLRSAGIAWKPIRRISICLKISKEGRGEGLGHSPYQAYRPSLVSYLLKHLVCLYWQSLF